MKLRPEERPEPSKWPLYIAELIGWVLMVSLFAGAFWVVGTILDAIGLI